MEASRSIREDFLHQNSFHEIDTYTSLKKQHMMMNLVLAYYEQAVAALEKGAPLQELIDLPVREQIGRFKYTLEDHVDAEYAEVEKALQTEITKALGKEGF
jgi:V/A-type H+-transporting ATPase subunit A